MANPKLRITKSTGESAPFSPKKLLHSLTRSGANPKRAQEILNEIRNNLFPGITTREIYRMAYALLKSSGRHFAARYNLKRSILELGPEGFAFEKFIGAVMAKQGYEVHTGVIEQGRCVAHEIDVFARKDDEVHFMECKFHRHDGLNCDVKVPLYIHSRFNDVSAHYSTIAGNEKLRLFGWVVTNTRFTFDAMTYGKCAGLRLLSWDYPEGVGLRELTDKLHLYPLTCLTSLTKQDKQLLLEKGYVLASHLAGKSRELARLGMKPAKISTVLNEVGQLCSNNTHANEPGIIIS
jgi:hypothetical protein